MNYYFSDYTIDDWNEIKKELLITVPCGFGSVGYSLNYNDIMEMEMDFIEELYDKKVDIIEQLSR